MKRSIPPRKDLVLIGGGHSHAIALKQFSMKPIPGIRLTLITDVYHTPYSGMLPGYVAGLYKFDECHIDLRPLTQFVGARMFADKAIALDLEKNLVICANRPPVPFDLLSIDIGSTPASVTVPGAAEGAIPVKPISQFLAYWDEVTAEVERSPERKMRIGIVGGGAGGVELALSVRARLHRIYQQNQQPTHNLELHLFHRGAKLLPERNPRVGEKLEQILRRQGVQLHLEESVAGLERRTGILPVSGLEGILPVSGLERKTGETPVSDLEPVSPVSLVSCDSGLAVECDRVFWVTQASAAPWLKKSGLAADERGFIRVNDALQSVSHSQVFAAGDAATMVNHPRPKAGVFAVRQGQPLFENLQRSLLGKPLKPFAPQKQFLILVGTGEEEALASRGWFGLGPNSLLWRWKDKIDREFMERFANLEPMSEPRQVPEAEPSMRCAGCGAKVGGSILKRVLKRIQAENSSMPKREDIFIGLDGAEDAAAVQVPAGRVMVQTIDYFRALLDDPFLLGKIAANHCLSDLFAMGATPQSAQAIATIPHAAPAKVEEDLYQLLSGAVQMLEKAGAVLIGGHTSEGSELAFGLACNGLAFPDKLLRKGGMKPGDALILTKALGTGTLFAADMRLRAKGRWIEGAIKSMLVSNQRAAALLVEGGATACTDVTGFGLLGHLLEMMAPAGVAVELELEAIPVLPGAAETLAQGIFSSLHPENFLQSRFVENGEVATGHPLYPILFDPQTSGGLLASVPSDRSSACLDALRREHPESRIIGRVVDRGRQSVIIK